MYEVIIATVITISLVGVVAAGILYWASQKFKVHEDPRIDEVERALPSANCGGCGFPGCRNFAEMCVKTRSLDNLYCPVGGNELTANIAKILGRTAVVKQKEIAVVKCNGTPEFCKKTTEYNGVENCTIVSNLYSGETACQYGCLGFGECCEVCSFDAISMNPKTGLPEVDEEKCTGCNACAQICPRNIIEMRPQGKKNRRIFVSCVNEEKGGVAKRACSVACIGCNKCVKVCKFDAVIVKDFLAYINPVKCKLCRKCVTECPTSAIWEVNFPARKLKKEQAENTSADETIENSISTVKNTKANGNSE